VIFLGDTPKNSFEVKPALSAINENLSRFAQNIAVALRGPREVAIAASTALRLNELSEDGKDVSDARAQLQTYLLVEILDALNEIAHEMPEK
jgi:hypothetical protein